MPIIFWLAPLAVFVYMIVWFLGSVLKKRNDVADIAWGVGFALVAVLGFFINFWINLENRFAGPKSWLVTFFVVIWGVRLAWHIYLRHRGKPEDFRYQKWREEWGNWFYLRSFLQVFILQGFLLLLVSTPVIWIGAYDDGRFGFLELIGAIIWITGFLFESIGDWQLKKFISDVSNQGKIMQGGLWRYTRHPNYFGEVIMWWGIWLVASPLPNSYIALLGPLTITVLILKISGIPMLEKKFIGNPEWEEYKRRTSSFFPWWPRK